MRSLAARKRTRGAAALCALTALLAALHALAAPPPAAASGSQIPMLMDGSLLSNPVGAMQEMRHLGVRVVRVFVRWSQVAPDPMSHRRPRFNESNPSSYPKSAWSSFDALDRAAAADNIGILMSVTGGAPEWADGRGAPAVVDSNDLFAWNPSISQFGQFFHAVAERYSGGFRPCRGCGPLPAVRYWEIYNEPNFGEDLAPQAIDGSRVLSAPNVYRRIVAASWDALRATGHGRDTILLGGLAAQGADGPPSRGAPQGFPGNFGETKPLEFIRALYCLDNHYRPYRGAAARIRRCPATAAASRRFRAHNPGLFNSAGFAVHPYPLGPDTTVPPNRTVSPDRNYAALSQLPNMARTLDRTLRAYGSRRRLRIWNTEYGYITNPPNRTGVSLATQAFYLNWAEYLSWRNPRIQSFMQYLLTDPNPTSGVSEPGGFSSGLLFYGGRPKPSYDAWRLPIYMPSTTARRGRSLRVWGCVRPAYFAALDTHQPQHAYIQFRGAGSALWTTVSTLTFNGPSCYFDVPVRFPSSGTVRLVYTYPPGDARLTPTIFRSYVDPLAPAQSRPVGITIK